MIFLLRLRIALVYVHSVAASLSLSATSSRTDWLVLILDSEWHYSRARGLAAFLAIRQGFAHFGGKIFRDPLNLPDTLRVSD